jgi:hypothetical protein
MIVNDTNDEWGQLYTLIDFIILNIEMSHDK